MNHLTKLLKFKNRRNGKNETKCEDDLENFSGYHSAIFRNDTDQSSKTEALKDAMTRRRIRSHGSLSLKALRKRKELESELTQFDASLCKIDENLELLDCKQTNDKVIESLKIGMKSLRNLQKRANSYIVNSKMDDFELQYTEEELQEELQSLEILYPQHRSNCSKSRDLESHLTLFARTAWFDLQMWKVAI
ncbi:unnamed protein product [Heterobilharzia americana]|nr:unnamed protein product [Heterobilharzia americana]